MKRIIFLQVSDDMNREETDELVVALGRAQIPGYTFVIAGDAYRAMSGAEVNAFLNQCKEMVSRT